MTAKAAKIGRRLSARVGDLFKGKARTEVAAPAKVDEHPPKIDEHKPVAPLENPATEEAPAAEASTKADEPVAEVAPTSAPVVAAAA